MPDAIETELSGTEGWWAGFIWVGVALLLCISVIGLPIGLLMLSRALDSFIL
ncbi:hypothetical protein [Deinococcus aquaticus]|uniref:hypothetical protein n=1 Tax=Deinococcus aquaticus TaxID=328692 RepID=UPI003F452076